MTCAHMMSVLPTASVKYLVRGKRLEAGCERPEVGGKRRKVKGKRDLRTLQSVPLQSNCTANGRLSGSKDDKPDRPEIKMEGDGCRRQLQATACANHFVL